MGSIAHCLHKMGLSKQEEKLIRERAAELRADGYTAQEASVQAVQDHVSELEAQHEDVLSQLASAQPAKPAKPVVAEPGVEKTSASKHDFGKITPGQEQALKNTGGIVTPLTMKQKYQAHRKDVGLKLTQGIADQFASIKGLDPHAYLLARLSKASDGALEAVMTFGNLSLVDGVTDSNAEGLGFIDTLKKLEGEHHRFMWWVAAHRAGQLTQEQRENLFSATDIAELKKLADGTLGDVPGGRSRMDAYRTALDEYNKVSRNILDIAEASGIIDGESRSMWEKEFYVPFYRAIEDGKATSNIHTGSGLVRQYAFKKLKGGQEKLHQDLLANVLMNWSHLLSASAKNRAARATLIAAENAGVATEQPGFAVSGRAIPKDVVWYMEHGKESYYTVDDPLVVDSITALSAGVVGGTAGELLGKFKNALTIGVTANPAFKIRNLIRDSIASVAMADIGYNVAGNVATGVGVMAGKKSQTYASLLAGGGLIRFGSMLDGNRSSHVDKLVKAGVKINTIVDTKEKMLDMLQVAWDHYNELGDISEGANRASLYSQLRKQGKTHAEASLATRDLMDFSMGGTWGAVRFLTQTVPFMNARIQGLHKMGRAAYDNPGRMAAVLGTVALASIALMLAYSDDDDWKKREGWDRDNYWWFKIGGVAYRIPKPFEVGAIGTLAERGVELWTNDEFTAKQFRERLAFAIGQTFAFNPVPQLFKPMWDVYANTDSFTGNPIESRGQEAISKSRRVNRGTSEFARATSLALEAGSKMIGGNDSPLSPEQIDHMVKGYFGWLGTAALVSSSALVSPVTDRPEKPTMQLKDTFLAGNFVESLPSDRSKYVTQFYEQAKLITEAYSDYKDIQKTGTKAEAAEFRAEHATEIRLEPKAAAYQRQLSEITAAVRKVEASRDMDSDMKRTKLSLLYAKRNSISEKASRALRID